VVLVLSGGIWQAVPRAHAQGGNDPIVLNDATPGVDVVVNLAPGTSGVVSLQVEQASVRVTDSSGVAVFQTADARVHALEFRFGPDSGTHTITIERLPGVTEAYARVVSQADLNDTGSGTLVTSNLLTDQQQADFPLTNITPSGTVDITIPNGLTETVTMSFPGAPVTAQLVDTNGTAVASLYGSRIDGLSVALEGGDYELTMLNTNVAQNTVANVSVQPAEMAALATESSTTTVAAQTTTTTTAQNVSCSVDIQVSSVNLRSGPGQGYSVSGYGFRGDQLLVGGTNTDGSWLLVGTENGSAWMIGNAGQLNNQCSNLTVYDIPYRDAPTPQIVVQETGSFFQGSGEHENDGEHEYEEDDD
jgi:uncharacterized protein YraI